MIRILSAILILLCSLFSEGYVFSAWDSQTGCPNQDVPSDLLTQYIATVDQVLSDIRDKTASSRCDTYQNPDPTQPRKNSAVATISRSASEVTRTVNQAITFDNFFLSSEFYFKLALKGNVPQSFMRDNDLIQDQQMKIQQTLARIHKRCAADVMVTVPGLSPDSASALLNRMIANNIAIHNLFRKIVLGHIVSDSNLAEETSTLILVEPRFAEDLVITYGPDAYQACIENGDYWNRIKKRFQKIGELFSWNNTATRNWIDAWSLLNGGGMKNSETYAQVEKRLLASELDRQGFSPKASDQFLKNLDTFNSDYASNGPVAILKSIGDRSIQSLEQIYDAGSQIIESFRSALSSGSLSKTTTDRYARFLSDVGSESELDVIIKTEYIQNKAIIGIGAPSESKYAGTLYGLHSQLVAIIQTIQENYKIAEGVCNKQKTGMGVCSYR